MNNDLILQITEAEEKLRLAMLSSNVSILDEILSEDLIFTNHLGQCLSKEDDLSAHRTGALIISNLKPTERKISLIGNNVAIVSVRVQLEGTYAGQPTGGDFRFTRVWALSSDSMWQVAAAHSGIIS